MSAGTCFCLITPTTKRVTQETHTVAYFHARRKTNDIANNENLCRQRVVGAVANHGGRRRQHGLERAHHFGGVALLNVRERAREDNGEEQVEGKVNVNLVRWNRLIAVGDQ
jgi:hypothetical protein